MSNDNKTLADAQPGGRVRLGDQAELDRLEFQAWAEQLKHTLTRWGNGPGDVTPLFVSEVAGNYISPATQAAWEAWRHLSAQPSPGGQGAPFPWENFPAYLIDKCEGDTISEEGLQQALASMAKDQRYCLAARQPSKQPDSVALGEATEFCIEKGGRQPVGQIPAGFVLVPEKFGIPAEVWEGVEFVIGGPGTGEGEAYLDSTAWIGDLMQDDGSSIYGLHLSCDECPEEGSVTLSVFTARAEVQP